jgi:eukaryotic-like serine/threonine-protein kinase
VADPDLSGAVLDGRYQVISPISEGAMGSVYRGERLKLGRAVAIKIMHEALPDELASRQRFEREAKLMAMLEHPHCVSVIDFGVHDDKPFLVMELVRGTSLQELIDKEGHLTIARAAEIMRQVLSGLAHAHELGIIHRDIKPANIMVTSQTGLGEQVRILDFGLARLTEGSTKLTTGIVVGTPNYMAPEQCRGGDLDGRTDLYACGVMLFELLAGRKPFVADDPIAVVRKHIGEPPPRLADVAPGSDFGDFEAICARALAKASADRFATAQEMSAAIDAALKKGVAQVFARAVPQGGAAMAAAQATPSGWNVPSTFAAPADSLSIPQDPGSMPITDSQMIPGSQPMVPEAPAAPMQIPGSAPSGPMQAPASAMQIPGSAPSGPMHVAGSAPAVAPDPAFAGHAPAVVPPPVEPPAPRPRPAARGPGGLPLSRTQLMIGGGAVLGIIILIAVVAGGGGHKGGKPASDAALAHVADAAAGDPVPDLLARAHDLEQQGDPEAALSILTKARREHPESAPLAAEVGQLYFNKLWWTDGIKNFRDAIRLDPSLRSDPDIIKTVLKGFITTPDVDDRLEGFLREDLGDAARPYLEETAKSHPNKQTRARAAAELRRIH